MATSPSSFDPIREWTVDGEEWCSLHPLIHAMREFGLIRAGRDGLHDTSRRLLEFRSGERRISGALVTRTLEIDAEQQRNGCPDDARGFLEQLAGRAEGGR
jgi:hypothetical protein